MTLNARQTQELMGLNVVDDTDMASIIPLPRVHSPLSPPLLRARFSPGCPTSASMCV
jgi:hypothetical protein